MAQPRSKKTTAKPGKTKSKPGATRRQMGKVIAETIREYEQRLSVALRGVDIAVFNLDRDLRYTWMYQPQLGYSANEVIGFTDEQLLPPGDGAIVQKIKQKVLQSGEPAREEILIHSAEKTRVFDLAVEALKDENGDIIGVTGSSLDITEHKLSEANILRLNRLYRTISQINQTIVRVRDRNQLFEQICKVVVENGKFRMAWIGLVDDLNDRVYPAYFAGEELGYLQNISIKRQDEVLGRGPTGTAIREERCIICQDIVTDERMKPWREAALQRGYRSSAAVPFREGGVVIGAFTVYAGEPNEFDLDDEELLDGISRDISFVLDVIQSEQGLKESEERYHLLFETSMDSILLTAPDGSIFAANPAACRMLGRTEEEIKRLGRDGIVDRTDPRLKAALAERARSGQFHGELTMLRRSDEKFEVEISTALFKDREGRDRTSMLIRDISDRKQADAKIKRQVEYLTALRDIDHAIESSFDMGVSLNLLLSRAVSLLEVDAAAVMLVTPDLGRLEYAAGIGFQTAAIERFDTRMGAGLAGRVAADGRLIQYSSLTKDLDKQLQSLGLSREMFHGYCGVPLISKGKVIGVLEVFHRASVERDQDWLDFLNTLAGQAALAIDNTQMFTGLQRSNMDLVVAYDATIVGWSRAMDLRDKETEGHTQRVAEMTEKLAERIGVKPDAVVQIRRGGLLHDIGKLGIPDAILFKADKLNTEEWEIMKKHPVYARDMLLPISYLRGALDIPYCHHEKWDGTGYPQGLRREQIPLAARIFSIVDVWDAVTSNRPYRLAWTKDQALEYIKEQSGKHFDPDIVKVFLDLIIEKS